MVADDEADIVSLTKAILEREGYRVVTASNGLEALQKVEAELVRSGVPEKSMENATEFWRCDSCRKVYWDGTHWTGILDRFDRLGLVKGDSG